MDPNHQGSFDSQKIILQLTTKPIRSVIFLRENSLTCIMCMLQILVIQYSSGSLVKTIKRTTAPKYVFAIGKHYLLIHYSDNYCVLYDTVMFQEMYIFVGVPNDHKGIKVSGDGLHLLYGNDTAMQIWSLARCQIEMLSHKMKYISCYNINHNCSSLYFGNYNGQIQVMQLLAIKQLRNDKIPYPQVVLKPHSKVVLGIEVLSNICIASIDYSLQCALISLGPFRYQILCRVETSVLSITKPTSFIYSLGSGCLYFSKNDYVFKMEIDNKKGVQLGSQGNLILIKYGSSVKIGKYQSQDRSKIALIDQEKFLS